MQIQAQQKTKLESLSRSKMIRFEIKHLGDKLYSIRQQSSGCFKYTNISIEDYSKLIFLKNSHFDCIDSVDLIDIISDDHES